MVITLGFEPSNLSSNLSFPSKKGDRCHRLYQVWGNMKARCASVNPRKRSIKHYKGITVCDAWKNYKLFEKWALANGYDDNLTIDREDSSKGYYPENCRWITLYHNGFRARACMTLGEADEIRKIVKRLGWGGQRRLARAYRLPEYTISKICKNTTYKGEK